MDESERIDHKIRLLHQDADDLAELFEEGDLTEGEVDFWAFNLPDALVGASRLEAAYRAGSMSVEQLQRYEELKARLRELAPEIERVMELRVPREILENR